MQHHKVSDKGLQFIASKEGLCQTKYDDIVGRPKDPGARGVWTIGIGITRSQIPDLYKWPMNKKLTIKECIDLFKTSLAKYERAVNKHLTRPVKQHEFDALVSWCYNVGPGWLKKATVMRRINNGESGKRLYDALMMYRKPKAIIGRRKAEARLLAYGQYPAIMKVNVFPVSSRGTPIYSKGRALDLSPYLEGGVVHRKEPIQIPDKPLKDTDVTQKGEGWVDHLIKFLFEMFMRAGT